MLGIKQVYNNLLSFSQKLRIFVLWLKKLIIWKHNYFGVLADKFNSTTYDV